MIQKYPFASRGVRVGSTGVRVVTCAACLAACGVLLAAQTPLKYPSPRKGNTVDTYFGTKVPDPYRWMEDLNSPEVKQWVEAENTVTFKYLDSLS